MSGLSALLGDKLLGKNGSVSTSEATAGKSAIALYFSAHWCPPCRGFTPKLAEWYTKDLSGKGLEVVFVSSDRDEAAFTEYFGEQPWLALPYGDRERKEQLSKKFKVQGIPSVVILSPDGSVITKDGRGAISQDPTGQELPWKPKTLDEILADATLKGPSGECKGSSLKGKVFGLYFSAHWCPPCRGFTPKLAEWYKKDLQAKGLEVVFVSSDKDDASFNEYFAEQPWLALDFSDRKRKEQLSNLFGIEGIPSFVIVDADGSVITKDGRAAVTNDPTGAEFPWYPKPVADLKAGPGSLNEVPTLLVFCESSEQETQKAIEETLTPIAKDYLDKAKAAGEEDPALAVMMVTSSEGLSGRIRGMTSMPEAASGKAPQLMLLDIPDNGGFYTGPEGEVTTEVVGKFIADYFAKSLKRQQLA